jgi:protein gp37
MAKAARWPDLTGTERADKPWLNRLPRVIFVSDMGDALSEHNAIDSSNKPLPGGAVPFEFLRAEIIDTALSEKGRRHRWLWLTKRPRRMAEFTDWLRQQHDMELPANIWVGTTVTGREKIDRIPHLRRAGTARTIRFVSAEPLLEEITLSGHLDGVRWVIVGGESQQKEPAREFRCEWARRLRDECAAAGVALFVKQLGSRPTDGGVALSLVGGHGGDWSEWPSDLQIRQIA